MMVDRSFLFEMNRTLHPPNVLHWIRTFYLLFFSKVQQIFIIVILLLFEQIWIIENIPISGCLVVNSHSLVQLSLNKGCIQVIVHEALLFLHIDLTIDIINLKNQSLVKYRSK